MHARTQATIDKLEQAEWFRAAGQQDTDAAIVLSSWKEAIKSCSSDEWEELLNEAANQYRERLLERDKERFNQWNVIVREIKVVTMPLVERKIAGVMEQHKLPKVFADTVNWDILHAAIEAEFADVFEPGFYASQAYWYEKGHFPCGWEGDFPDGKLVIY